MISFTFSMHRCVSFNLFTFTNSIRVTQDYIYIIIKHLKINNMYKLKLITFNIALTFFVLNIINFVYQLINIIM